MSNTASSIEWTDVTWNPVTGCQKVSEGCKNCYAEQVFNRMAQNPKTPAYHGRKFTDVKCHEDRLAEPLHWKKPRRVFVNSMSDLFHESVPDEFILRVIGVMNDCRQHTFQILTKRPERMRDIARRVRWAQWAHDPNSGNIWLTDNPDARDGFRLFGGAGCSPMSNVWLGVSIEDQKTARERIWPLLTTPAKVRFISYEPALGPIDLNDIEALIDKRRFKYTLGRYLDWVIAGGESGPNARPSHPDWFRSVRDQCQASRVPFLFKQWGEYMPQERISWMGAEPIESCKAEILMAVCRVGKQCAGRLLDGREWNEFPEGRLEC